jgi:hypothetical protein
VPAPTVCDVGRGRPPDGVAGDRGRLGPGPAPAPSAL